MRVRLVRGSCSAVVACLTAVALGCLGGCDEGRAASERASAGRPTPRPGETLVRVLQMNLCNSGRAACYTGGRAVSMAVTVIRQRRPDMVSVNEVCRGDVHVLEQAMSAASSGGVVAAAFAPAKDRPTRSPVRCQNGEEFGDGVLVVVAPPAVASRSYSGVYPVQDPEDVEERVWVCLDLPTRWSACTTHTASTSSAVALEQCRFLLTAVVANIGRRHPGEPTILGADLNLAAGGSPSPQSCLPDGYHRTDDAAVQHVVMSPGTAVQSHAVIDMRGTTDHPGLLVDVVLPHH